MKKHNILFKKLNSIYGFSLTETLTTMIIMSFVGIMITTGIMSSTRAYKQITEYTNAQLILSNTITALHDELIYALPDSLNVTGQTIKFEHIKNGIETITYKDEATVITESSDDSSDESEDTVTTYNKGIYISYGNDSDAYYPIVSYQNSTSLYNDWTVTNKGNGVLSVSVSVYKADKTTPLIKVEGYEIKLLNG